ncbi:GNAT family N-acetyltransferase [Streptomyces sp. L7]
MPWPPEPIRTERLLLRESEARDRAVFVELLASAEAHTYLGGARPRGRAGAGGARDPGPVAGGFVVELDGVMIGHILLRRTTATANSRPTAVGKADLGYLFLPRAWGFGYAAEACAAALDWLAGVLPGAVMLTTQTANARSMRLAAKLGFVEVERFEAWDAEQWLGMRPPVVAPGHSYGGGPE